MIICFKNLRKYIRFTMPSRDIDIVVTDTDGGTIQHMVKKHSIWTKWFHDLQDNRMKANPNAEYILANSNPEEYRLLKNMLNACFLTTGIALLVAVVIVIFYSAFASNS